MPLLPKSNKPILLHISILMSYISILTAVKLDQIPDMKSVRLSEYQEGSPCLVIIKKGKDFDAYDPIIKPIIKDSIDEHDFAGLIAPHENSMLIFANVERQITYRGPLDTTMFAKAMKQFDIGSKMARFTDSNFEHDTQASSGSTTGDWLVIFGNLTHESEKLYESISLLHRGNSINFGVADIKFCPQTYKRFYMSDTNTHAIFLKSKQYYTYPSVLKSDTMASNLLAFAKGEYKNLAGRPIPRPRMLFDDVVDRVLSIFKSYENEHGTTRALVALGSIMVAVVSLLGLFIYILCEKSKGSLPGPDKEKKE